MSGPSVPMRALRSAGVLLLALSLASCAMVTAHSRKQAADLGQLRGDILLGGRLSDAATEALQVAGLEAKGCQRALEDCSAQLQALAGLTDERRTATLAELWTAHAMALSKGRGLDDSAALDGWLMVARYAYAYLFFTERRPADRAFVVRQGQVRDYYNTAVAQVGQRLFALADGVDLQGMRSAPQQFGRWSIRVEMGNFRLPGDLTTLDMLVPANTLRFDGLRSNYRRDGFGAELIARVPPLAVGDPTAVTNADDDRDTPDFSEIPYAPATLLLDFAGGNLAQVLAANQVVLRPYDPYRQQSVELHGDQVPLAGDFTGAYGLWLARSGFAEQSFHSLFGHARGIDRAHLYLMQPYDPDRRILLMLHGLGSSPEAWVNVANEVMGDEALRQHYQIWQVYYPTNMPIAFNRAQIQSLVEQSLAHFDPHGTARASQHMVLVGHSMGGVIARLLVSDSGEVLWDDFTARRRLDDAEHQRVRERLQPLLHFSPLPQVDRAILIAAPIRGTPIAAGGLGRLVGRLVRLPVRMVEKFGEVLRDLAGNDGQEGPGAPTVPNAIDNLRDTDPFIRASATLPIAPGVRYNTIIARRDPSVPLAKADDGLVPYASAHLDGAESEKVITSWHSVQENPQAILEIRRILHAQMQAEGGTR